MVAGGAYYGERIQSWRPRGHLVAHLTEHKKRVSGKRQNIDYLVIYKLIIPISYISHQGTIDINIYT